MPAGKQVHQHHRRGQIVVEHHPSGGVQQRGPVGGELGRDQALAGTALRLRPSTSAIMPGRMTRKGKSIFGTAAISGVRRAAVIESAAMARCTTRKSVHQ